MQFYTQIIVRNVSIVTVGERQLQSNEDFLASEKLNCPTADIGELTQSTHKRR